MGPFYRIEFGMMVKGALATESVYTTTAVDLESIVEFCKSQGVTFKHQTVPIVVFDRPTTEIQSMIEEWATSQLEPEPAPAVTLDPSDARLNELERSMRNTDRQMQQMLAGMTQLTQAVGALANRGDRSSAPDDQEVGDGDWRHFDKATQQQADRGARTTGADRRSQRQRLAEFKGSAEHRDNSMGIQSGPSASPVAGFGPMHGGTGIIAVGGINSKGEAEIVNVPSMTVGDTMKRGNLLG